MNPPDPLGGMASPDDPVFTTAPLQVLCIEDNHVDFELLRDYLKRAVFPRPIDLDRAGSIGEARQRFENGGTPKIYDIVLLDLSLPDSQGAESYYSLYAFAPQTAVVILSGNNDQELALQLVQSGAQDYLPKDALSSNLLVRSITYAMKRQQHRTEMENLTARLRRATEELKTAQMQLIQLEKLESLGRLASSVAHEVKNPLGVLQMGVDFLQNNLAEVDGDVSRTLTIMKEAVERAECVIHDMLDFSHSEAGHMEAWPLNKIVRAVLRMLKHECDRHKVVIRTELAMPSPVARCERNRIEQVLLNVLTNAMQSMSEGGTVTVRTKLAPGAEIPRDAGLREISLMRPSDEVAIIEVQDQGTGIPEDILGRIFDPFFTTKPTGEGTGLGLPICRRVIELHRGRLLVANVDTPRGVLVSIVLKAEAPQPERPGATSKASNKPI